MPSMQTSPTPNQNAMPRFKEHEIGSEEEFFDRGTHSSQVNAGPSSRFKQSRYDPMSNNAVNAPSPMYQPSNSNSNPSSIINNDLSNQPYRAITNRSNS